MPSVSVIIPAYNASRYLRETLDSVLAQTFRDYEVIVVDDGSTDETPSILKEYDGRIRILRQPNQGLAMARNSGAKAARGKWLSFLDSDDLWASSKLEVQLREATGCVISYTNAVLFGEHLPREILYSDVTPQHQGNVVEHLLQNNFITASSVMIRKDIFDGIGGFDPSLWALEDWELWLKVCRRNPLGYVAEPLVRYRVRRDSMTSKVRRTLPCHMAVINSFFAAEDLGRRHPRLRRRALANSFRICGNVAAEGGDWTFAFRCALQSLFYDPTVVRTWKNLVKAGLMPLGVKY